MGADLLLEAVWSRVDTELDYESGKRIAQTLAEDAVRRLREQAPYLEDSSAEEVRERAADMVQMVQEGFDPAMYARDVFTLRSPDGRWWVHLTGGTSWGDSPSELFDALNELAAVPEVLAAIGFVTEPEVN